MSHLTLFILACSTTDFFFPHHTFCKHDDAPEIKELFVFLNPRFTFIYNRIQHLVINTVSVKLESKVIYHFFTKKQARFNVKLCRYDVVIQGVSFIVSVYTARLLHSKLACTSIHSNRYCTIYWHTQQQVSYSCTNISEEPAASVYTSLQQSQLWTDDLTEENIYFEQLQWTEICNIEIRDLSVLVRKRPGGRPWQRWWQILK